MVFESHKYPFLLAIIFFISGLILGDLHPLPFLLTLFFLLFSFLCLIIFFVKSFFPACSFLLLCCFLCLGLLRSSLEKIAFSENHLRNLIRTRSALFQRDGCDLSGTMTASIEPSSSGTSLVISHIHFFLKDKEMATEGKMKLFIPHPSEGQRILFRPGDRITAFARMKIPKNFANPGGFDYVSYLERRGIYLTGHVKSSRLISLERSKKWSWIALMVVLRQIISYKMEASFCHQDDYKEVGSFILAVTIGNRKDFKKKIEKILIRGGLYHLVAISGLHIAFIAYLIFRFLAFFRCSERLLCLITILLLSAYLPLSGSRSSALRAFLMAVIYLIGRMLYRKTHVLHTVSFSAFLLLLLKPCLIYDPGFQLTYAATLSIVFFYSWFINMIPWGNFFTSSCALAMAAQMGVFPLLAYHFHTVVWISLLTNVLALPVIALIIPLGFALELSLFLSDSLSHLFLCLLTILVRFIFSIASLYKFFPYLSFRTPEPPLPLLFLYYLTICSLPFLRRKIMKRFLWALFFFFLILISFHPFPPDINDRFEITFLDVGQGASAFIASPSGHCMIIDGGDRRGDHFDAGEMIVSEFLWHRGLKRIETIILTHLHSDHAGGIPSLIENFRIGQIILSKEEMEEKLFKEIKNLCTKRGIRMHLIEKDIVRHIDHMTLEIFLEHDEDQEARQENERSLMIKITYGPFRFLFTGDAPVSSEMKLLRSGKDVACEVLEIGHHGSNDSTSQLFLKAVHPRICIISCGAFNRWGHPMAEVLERISDSGARLYRTDKDGAITILTDGSSYLVKCHH